MGLKILVFLIILTKDFNVQCSSRDDEQCFEKSLEADDQFCQAIRIECPSGSVIYKPEIVASSGYCDRTGNPCEGVPVDLKVSLSLCYWKQTCEIDFPTTPVFRKDCVKEVNSLRLKSWKCIPKKDLTKSGIYHLMCNNTERNLGIGNGGIIRSHQHIPWDYNDSLFESSDNKCEKNVHVQYGGLPIQLSVDGLDIDDENDKLLINGVAVNQTDYNRYLRPGKQIIITFAKKRSIKGSVSNPSKGGSGFVVCIKKITTRERKANISACDKIMKTHKGTGKIVQPSNEYCQIKEQTTVSHIDKSQTDKETNVSNDKFCSKCLSRKTIYAKCKTSCCEGKIMHPKCSITNTTVPMKNTPQGTCKLSKKLIKNRCKNCCGIETKCRNKYTKTCPACCEGKDILKNCKKGRKRKNRKKEKRGKKGGKKRKKKEKKSNMATKRKGNDP